ncbi:TIGR02679 family protein [Microbacterium sp.]|uniref:TIGR02679 family protein n=1 Tax=Microbacterium sp. TaxID=51671 RepID=UPI0039E4C91E
MTAERVERLLGAPDLTGLIDVLARRVARGLPLSGRITLPVAVEDGAAVAALFGQRPRGGASVLVDLDRLDEIVRDSGAATSLLTAVEQLRGPIAVREHADRLRQAWDAAYATLDPLVASRPALAGWAAGLRSRGTVRRLVDTPDAGAHLLQRVMHVLSNLPTDGEALPRLAARLLGSAHALDLGTPEASLVLSALSTHGGGLGAAEERRGARQRRELWASVGVAVDELSSTVLVHRLALPGSLGDLTGAGEPVVLTLRQLRSLEVAVPRVPVFVCENPSVVDAAARELGAASRPLVCIQGQPSLAADLLLRRIAPAGLRYHGDFDWGGVRIANRIHAGPGFEPWRYRTVDLEQFADLPGAPLKGAPVEARWDGGVLAALKSRAVRLEEEQVIDVLLADLALSS